MTATPHTTPMLRSGYEWSAIIGVRVLHPHGWTSDATAFSTPITLEEFHRRLGDSVAVDRR